MKKFISALASMALAASVLVASVSAIDYPEDPNYGNPEAVPAVETAAVTDAITNAVDGVATIDVTSTGGAKVSKDVVAEIAKGETVVEFKVTEGLSVKIDPATISDDFDGELNLAIQVLTDASETEKVPETVSVPDNALIIALPMSGDFGVELEITLDAATLPEDLDLATAELYYISDDGVITRVEGGLTIDENGNPVIRLSHASSYVIANEAPVVAEDAEPTEDVVITPVEGPELPDERVSLDDVFGTAEDETDDVVAPEDTEIEETDETEVEASDETAAPADTADEDTADKDENVATGVTIALTAGMLVASAAVAFSTKKSRK